MKSKVEHRTMVKDGPTMTQIYAGAKVKGGPAKKTVKITKAKLTSDPTTQKAWGGGEKIKRVYKGGVLVKEKRRNISANKAIRKGLV